MMTKQDIFDHCVSYFNDRLNKGYFTNGWGSPDDPGQRCALGSISKEAFDTKYPESIEATIGFLTHRGKGVHHDFCWDIMKFNDNLAVSCINGAVLPEYKENYKKSIESFLTDLSMKYGLDYEPVVVTDSQPRTHALRWKNIEEEIV